MLWTIDLQSDKVDKCLSDWCFYLEKLFLILSQSSLPLYILSTPEGSAVLERISHHSKAKQRFYSTENVERCLSSLVYHIEHFPGDRVRPNFKKYLVSCWLKSGRTLWLCKEHFKKSDVNYTSDVDFPYEQVEISNYNNYNNIIKPDNDISKDENPNESIFKNETTESREKNSETESNEKEEEQKKVFNSLIIEKKRQKSQACNLS